MAIPMVRLMRSDQQVSTLAEAHELLWRQRPARDAAPQAWVDFHRHSAQVYARVSSVDQRHRYEALQCAAIETRKAQNIAHRLHPGRDGDQS